jgi:signal peptidase I
MGMRRRRLVDVTCLAVGLLVLAGGVYIHLADVRMQPVLSGSMRPTFSPGDLVITESVPLSSLAPGDVIAFYAPGSNVETLHRIVTISTSGSSRMATTKGDANSVADPWTGSLSDPTVPRLVAVLPGLGWIAQIRLLIYGAAGLALLAALLLEIWRFGRRGRLLKRGIVDPARSVNDAAR